MKSIKDLREQNSLLSEKEEHDMNKLSQLVRAGLFDAKKLPALKRAMDKPVDKMTAPEKRIMINLLNSLMDEVLSDKQVYRKIKQDVMVKEAKEDKDSKTIPNILILQRKSVRQFQDGLVGLYYARKIDKYVSIPFFQPSKVVVTEEKTNLEKIKTIEEECEISFEDGNKYNVSSSVANKIVSVYEAMNKKNKKKMEKMLSESIESFNKVMNFAVRQ